MSRDAAPAAVVIGAGSGGLTVAIGLAQLGRRVVLVEAGHVGGDCTNVGCIPSKTLIHQARSGAGGSDALARTRERRDALRDRESHELAEMENLELVRGRARLRADRTVVVDLDGGGDRVISGGAVVIATGSRPRLVDIPGVPPERLLTNESVFDLADPPGHLAIVGAGPIGVELAFAFARLGSRVSMVALDPRVLPREDPEASQAARPALESRGVDVHLGVSPTGFDAATRTLVSTGAGREVALREVDHVLVAIGRAPNVDGLDLAAAGVRTQPSGIVVDRAGRTSARGVYAIGDVTGVSLHTHAANAQGRRVVRRIAFPFLPTPRRAPLMPRVTFGEPEVASVGPTPDELSRRFHPDALVRLRVDLADLDRGYTDGVETGFVSVTAIRLTGRILAATVVAPAAGEMISLFSLAIDRGVRLGGLFRLVYPYPTHSGAVGKVADEFMRRTLPNLRRELAAYLRHRVAPRRRSKS